LALAASLVWHLFWLSSVKIFVSAPAVADRSESTVSFIGSILEDSSILSVKASVRAASDAEIKRLQDPALRFAQDSALRFAQDSALRFAQNPALLSQDLVAAPETAAGRNGLSGNEKLASVSDFDILKEMNAKSSADTAVGAKQMPEKPFDKVMVSYKTYTPEIEGPARFREVIYKPELPAYLRWDEGLGVDLDRMGNIFSIELKFRVSPEGKVESIERMSSSGHPTVDLVGMRYLKGWQFAPLKAGGPKEGQNPERSEGQDPRRSQGQWGTVKLNFSLSKTGAK